MTPLLQLPSNTQKVSSILLEYFHRTGFDFRMGQCCRILIGSMYRLDVLRVRLP